MKLELELAVIVGLAGKNTLEVLSNRLGQTPRLQSESTSFDRGNAAIPVSSSRRYYVVLFPRLRGPVIIIWKNLDAV